MFNMSTSISIVNLRPELDRLSTPSSSTTRTTLGVRTSSKKYKGIRRRKWGKWVSEIRVRGTQERLWLGSYSSPEAAAMAHDIAFYCLRGLSSTDNLNFPLMLPSCVKAEMSPASVQRAASDAGMAVDAQIILKKSSDHDHLNNDVMETNYVCGSIRSNAIPWTESWEDACYGKCEASEMREGEGLSISVEDYL